MGKEGIAAYPSGSMDIFNSSRGGVYLLRYIPEETSFELQAGLPKYFQGSRRYDLLSREDAEVFVHRLAALGSSLRAKYAGRFLRHLRTGIIGELLDGALDAQSISLLEATEDWLPDLLHEQLRWPCVVDEYLVAREFSGLSLDYSKITELGGNPLRALIAGLGIVRVGHWLGLNTTEIQTTLDLLERGSRGETVPPADLTIRPYAETVVIPIYSFGFQGAIIGFFSNLTPEKKAYARCVLDQAGDCLGELYALERRTSLVNSLRYTDGNASVLADAALQMASPVEYIVASRNGEYHGYTICREHDYLAGYNRISGVDAEQLESKRDNEFVEIHSLDPPARIAFKPLRGYAALDPSIHAIRIKTALTGFLSSQAIGKFLETAPSATSRVTTLNLESLNQIISALEQQMLDSHGKRAAAKHLCFFEAIKDKIAIGEMKLTNAEMQRRMSSKLETEKCNGYQVTGEALKKFSQEVDGLLPNRFFFEFVSEKVILVRWYL